MTLPDSPPDFSREETYAATRAPVDFARTLNPDAYRDAEYFRQERERLFARNWIAVGPLDRVRNPGDLMVADIAGRSVLIARGDDGELRGFLNVCRHRGTRLRESDGRTDKYIRCPYHGWGYNLRGECVGTPLFEGREVDEKVLRMFDTSHLRAFDKKDCALLPVRADSWGPMVFACLDESAPSLSEHVGDLPERLRGHEMNLWETAGEKRYAIGANWKLLVENAIEYYHLPWVHPRLAKTSRVADHHRWQGRGMYCGICTSPVTATDDSSWLSLPPAPGLSGADLDSGYFFGLFPNLIVFVMPSHAFIIRAHPEAPGRTTETAWLVAPPESLAAGGKKAVAGTLEFWDEVNREDIGIVEKVQRGLETPEYPGGRMCYKFEEPVHRFQNMVADAMVGVRRVPPGDGESGSDFIDYRPRKTNGVAPSGAGTGTVGAGAGMETAAAL